jgi:hypothetical protein
MKAQNYVRKHNSSSIFVRHDIITAHYEKMKHEYKILLKRVKEEQHKTETTSLID